MKPKPHNASCLKCGKTYRARPSSLAKGWDKYCSVVCKKEHLPRHKRGIGFCWDCKQFLPLNLDNFYKNKNNDSGFSTECKPCKKKYQRHRNWELRQRRVKFIIDSGSKCNACGIFNESTSFFDIDHIIPIKHLGIPRNSNIGEAKNIQVLCPNCHRLKNIKEQFKGLYETQDNIF